MPDETVPTRDPAGDVPAGGERFTHGLILDVAQVLDEHGYDVRGDRRAMVELQVHLFHLLHGAERGHDRCHGGAR